MPPPVTGPDPTGNAPPQGAAAMRLTRRDLAPTRIWQFDLTDWRGHFAGWCAELDRQRSQDAELRNGRSTRQGWSGPKTLFAEPGMALLRTLATRAVEQALADMDPLEPLPLAFEAWGNVHDAGGFNMSHIHQGALLSGVFYASAPPGSGAIVFRDPRAGPFHGLRAWRGQNAYVESRFTPRDGTMLLFPPWLEHWVEPHAGPSPRYAVAFNVVMAGQSPAKPAA